MAKRGYRVSVIRFVNEVEHDLVAFAGQLVRIPSVTGNEGDVATALLARLQDIGVDESWIDEAGNVIGVLYGSDHGPNILLSGHLDVVPPGRQDSWDFDPFVGDIDQEGRLRGRGSTDMKGGLAALVFTMKLMKDLQSRGLQLPGNVIFGAVIHEEAAEMLGMEFLCRSTLPRKGLGFDLCYLAEPSNGRVVLGHRGKVELVVTTRGVAAHSSMPWMGVNALQTMLPVLEMIFGQGGERLPSHPDLGKASITVTNLVCRPGALSVTPDECEISVDRRYLPGETLETIQQQFVAFLATIKAKYPHLDANVRVRTFDETSYTGYQKTVTKHHPVWILARDNRYVQETIRALQLVGQDTKIGYKMAGTDASMTAGVLGIPTIIFSWARAELCHKANEYMSVKRITMTLEAYAAILCRIYGIDLAQLG